MISIPSTDSLVPRSHRLANGRTLYYFPSDSTDLVKIDLVSESGSAYQSQPLVAAAANRLYTVAGGDLSASQLAEFLDYRGIIIDSNNTITHCSTSFYTLARHLDALLPVVDDLVRRPLFPEVDFDVYWRERRQKIASAQMKSSDMARRVFYDALFGPRHPLGRYAVPEDADRLSLDEVKRFYAERHRAEDLTIVLSGHVDDCLLQAIDDRFGHSTPGDALPRITFAGTPIVDPSRRDYPIAGAVQTTVRVGRLLTLAWDDPDYARLMLLVTLLGGYFGSRLMSNLREDKGYTYGIYARTQIYRGAIVFYITADVAGDAAADAEREIMHELQRLVDEPVADDELNLVRTVLVGDFLRSVDGIFERSTRFIDMLGTDVTERFTDNLRQALLTATTADLQRLAATHLAPGLMTVCRAGAL
ncbi:MAG: insulinase family protein [Bacteroidales bacterium]|nr:insulinase family protein [Bacteroidales bacterium]